MEGHTFFLQGSLDDIETKILATAFEEALNLADITDRTSLEAEAIARRILLLFKMGERDPKQMSFEAVGN
jgi:hypothetical protein